MDSSYISIRIINIDYYLSSPGHFDRKQSPFSETDIDRVPVIRIFGSTPAGQKTCLHVHQAYPYFYVPFPLPSNDTEDIQQAIYQFGASINCAMKVSEKDVTRAYNGHYLAGVVLVKGVPFYGYHVGYQTYLKIYLLNPTDKPRMLELLQSGAIMNTEYQPHEAHVPYELQFLMDYNLFGMNFIHIHINSSVLPHKDHCEPWVQFSVRFRLPIPEEVNISETHRSSQLSASHSQNTNSTSSLFTKKTVPDDLQWDEYSRLSHCELELDTTVLTVSNRLQLKESSIHTSLMGEKKTQEGILGEESRGNHTPLVKSLSALWIDEKHRRLAKGLSGPALPIRQYEERNIKEFYPLIERLRKSLKERIEQDSLSFSENDCLPPGILTTHQAVEALYPPEYFQLKEASMIDENENGTQNTALSYNSSLSSELMGSQSFWGSDLDENELVAMLKQEEMKYEEEHRLKEEQEDNAFFEDYEDEFEKDILEWIEQAESIEKASINPPVEISYEIPYIGKRAFQSCLDNAKNQMNEEKIDDKDKDNTTEGYDKVNSISFHQQLDISPLPEKEYSKNSKRMSEVHKPKPRSSSPANESNEEQQELGYPSSTQYDIGSTHEDTVSFSNSFNFADFSCDDSKNARSLFLGDSIEDSMEINASPKELGLSSVPLDDVPLYKEYKYSYPPPDINIPTCTVYQEPFYSNPKDVPNYTKEFYGKEFKVISKSVQHLRDFDPSIYTGTSFVKPQHKYSPNKSNITMWSPTMPPPSFNEVEEWQKNQLFALVRDTQNCTSITSPTVKTDFQMDILSLEIHVDTHDQLLPDPSNDQVQLIFWCLCKAYISTNDKGNTNKYTGVISLNPIPISKIGIAEIQFDYVQNERELFYTLIRKVRMYDPDILTGYELNNSSWGYLIERALILGKSIPFSNEISRIHHNTNAENRNTWAYKKTSIDQIPGRHMINIWRLMKQEMILTSYTFENVAYKLLDQRVPYYSPKVLTSWNKHSTVLFHHRLLRYYIDRVQMNLKILSISGVISRTSESARIFGINFYSVLTRGSQFRVESVMFRIAKPENYVILSPSKKQVGQQQALECQPLVLEPESKLYTSPIAVLDFQSLYPSIIIAYNYCYSTCLGKVNLKSDKKFGVGTLNVPEGLVGVLKDHINVASNGIMYVDQTIRKSLLGKMLEDILEARVMVKQAMNDYIQDEDLLRMLDYCQLNLKLIANVTYGYTAASYSGRMPATDLADSIVETGRVIMEKAISFINEHPTWGAKVVYGDTDSMFVHFPGKTRHEAFLLGKDIAEEVTKLNPCPIKLRFEKIYHPCILISKKRYTGYKYEHISSTKPVLESKGTEIVRSDGTAATQRIMQSAIEILFKTKDMSEVKNYLYREWNRVISDKISIQELIITKAVRLMKYTERSLPAGAQVAYNRMAIDPRTEPQYGERVPYVVIYKDGLNAKLSEQVVHPEALFLDSSLRLNAEYYIRKQLIPLLSRIFNLMGVDIKTWYDEMPRSQKAKAILSHHYRKSIKRSTHIDEYYKSNSCIVCRDHTSQSICTKCSKQPAQSIYTLISRQNQVQKKWKTIATHCHDCSRLPPIYTTPDESSEYSYATDHPCSSLDCPLFYDRVKTKNDLHEVAQYDPFIYQWPFADSFP
ncbi:hypothetical protein BDF14DRAFT_1716926 [Spinellus fusiger]|nr:hypothetical protein BDF14DRAFT_1716926 [Spinellus fusiger]